MANVPSLHDVASRLTDAVVVDQIRNGVGIMPGFPDLEDAEVVAIKDYLLEREEYEVSIDQKSVDGRNFVATGYVKMRDEEGFPAISPPWGKLNAVDLRKGHVVNDF